MTSLRGDMIRERRGATGPRQGIRARIARGAAPRALAALLSLGLVPAIGVTAPPPAYASATDYPSWDDVRRAQRDEAAAKALKKQLESSLAALQSEVARTQAELEEKGRKYEEAQAAFDEQAAVTQQIAAQAAEAQERADAAHKAAAQFIAAMSKTGGEDLTTRLLTAPGSPDGMLYRLETAGILSERYSRLYEQALHLQNVANARAEEERVAEEKLDELRVIAEAAFQEAQAAAQAAQAKLEKAEYDIAQLRAKIEVLEERRAATIAEYNAGIRAQWGAGAEGELSATGWARPSAGYISSGYGNRFHPIYETWMFHSGVDLAGQGCGATIRAAHGGTVTYAGPNGTLGNYVQINHGNGISTGYGHIMPGGIGVHIGQDVGPGQPIARVGTTGASTGCHLHFIVRVNGYTVDPVPFMRNQGITLG